MCGSAQSPAADLRAWHHRRVGSRAVRWITTQRDIADPRAAGSICGIYLLRAI
jgi:hypothetical protein